ncbi:hypothetical protein [Nannocystis pusilla]|uniref:hypothetical protein n=1 Tax=Nannocystis pusilla TaxID=889268 RepID=UPI003B77F235
MALVPETHLFPCARCSELLRVADPVCPHCGATRSRAERTGPLVALAAAFAMAACGTPSQPEYGLPDTESGSESLGTDATTTDATTTDATTTDATTTDATTTDATTTAPTTGTGTTDETTG